MYAADNEGWRKPTLAETCMMMQFAATLYGANQKTVAVPLNAEDVQELLGIETGSTEDGAVYAIIFTSTNYQGEINDIPI